MENDEIMQRAIGVLTLMHGAASGGPAGEGDDLRVALKMLQEDVFSYSVPLPQGEDVDPAEFLRQALEQIMARFATFTAGLALGFQAVAHAYEEECPDADVSAVLQELSIRITTRES
ncbi:hypothetical protein [Umezawaea beigongshangensis]|uniref:hypothetical protein n=1 Tax=Umezawaea beigongshangensis TaxID=2780383 RepID=UPI0018F23BE1|nr:hypothetical protein [Umezawaea beigongshangensis]